MTAEEIRTLEAFLIRDRVLREIAAQLAELNAALSVQNQLSAVSRIASALEGIERRG
jgi:hypothetical protein